MNFAQCTHGHAHFNIGVAATRKQILPSKLHMPEHEQGAGSAKY